MALGTLKILILGFSLVYTPTGADKSTESDRMGGNFEDGCE